MLRGLISARAIIFAILAIGAASCGKKSARAHAPIAPAKIGSEETGVASWYGVPYHGRRTASGEVYDMEQLTAAHRNLPFETWVEVTNMENGKRVDVRINDRGPFVRGRIIDLSQAAARDIDMLGPGTAKVRLRVIAAPPPSPDAIASVPPPVATPRYQEPSTEHPGSVNRTSPVAAKLAQPSPSLVTPNIPHYVVQAGAFADRERAESLRAKMTDLFAEARVASNGKTPPLWKVLVGREMTANQASELATRVKQEIGEALVMPEPAEVLP